MRDSLPRPGLGDHRNQQKNWFKKNLFLNINSKKYPWAASVSDNILPHFHLCRTACTAIDSYQWLCGKVYLLHLSLMNVKMLLLNPVKCWTNVRTNRATNQPTAGTITNVIHSRIVAIWRMNERTFQHICRIWHPGRGGGRGCRRWCSGVRQLVGNFHIERANKWTSVRTNNQVNEWMDGWIKWLNNRRPKSFIIFLSKDCRIGNN